MVVTDGIFIQNLIQNISPLSRQIKNQTSNVPTCDPHKFPDGVEPKSRFHVQEPFIYLNSYVSYYDDPEKFHRNLFGDCNATGFRWGKVVGVRSCVTAPCDEGGETAIACVPTTRSERFSVKKVVSVRKRWLDIPFVPSWPPLRVASREGRDGRHGFQHENSKVES